MGLPTLGQVLGKSGCNDTEVQINPGDDDLCLGDGGCGDLCLGDGGGDDLCLEDGGGGDLCLGDGGGGDSSDPEDGGGDGLCGLVKVFLWVLTKNDLSDPSDSSSGSFGSAQGGTTNHGGGGMKARLSRSLSS